MKYPGIFTPDFDKGDGGFIVEFPDFEAGVTQGDDFPEALAMAEDLLKTLIEEWIRQKKDLPTPSVRRGRNIHMVSPGALTEAKAQLYMALREQHLKKTELAARMKITKQQVERLLNPRHASRIDQLERAFKVLGKQMGCSVVNLPPPHSHSANKKPAEATR